MFWKTQSNLCYVSVPPSKVDISTQSGNALEDERYNEGTDLKLTCTVSGGIYMIFYFLLATRKLVKYFKSTPNELDFQVDNLSSLSSATLK